MMNKLVSPGDWDKSRVVRGYKFQGSMREFFCDNGILLHHDCRDGYYNLYIGNNYIEMYMYTHMHKSRLKMVKTEKGLYSC